MSSSFTIYGIKNCDTMKKAMRWLDSQGITYQLHDYKKSGIDTDTLQLWLEQTGADTLINRRGTTWRRLSDTDKAACDSGDPAAIARVLADNTSAIKRPVLPLDKQLLVGFNDATWTDAFKL